MSKAFPPRLSLLFVALALPLSGCAGYVSDYVPPDNGRARVLFRDTKAIASLPPVDYACLREVDGNPMGPSFRIVRSWGGARIVYWAPVHHGHVPHVGPSPGSFVSRPGATSGGGRNFASPSMQGSGGRASSGGTRSSGNRVSSSGGGGGGGDAGTAAVVLAVLAIAVLPVVTFSLVLSTPESEPNMSRSIDRVNFFNDLARSPGSPCAEPEPGLEPPPPPPAAPPVVGAP